MADISARRAAEVAQHLRLERQQRHDVIDVPCHRARATRPPSPHRRADVIDNSDSRGAGTHTSCHAMGEVRAVDDDQGVRLGRNHRIGGFTNAAQHFRQVHYDGAKSDDGELAGRETRHTRGRHLRPADAGNARVGDTPSDRGY